LVIGPFLVFFFHWFLYC